MKTATQNIMVVDDEEEIVRLMSQTLEIWGYNPVTAKDGEEALQKFGEAPIDLVITDLKLPKMNGVSLIEKVKHVSEDTEVIMFTGYPEVDTAVNAMKNGASDYLVKPIDLEDLRLKIERAIDKRNNQHSKRTFHGITWAVIISIPVWLITLTWIAYILKH